MPPKSGYARQPKPDLEWAGRDVKDVAAITPLHRRRAAGLAPDQRMSNCRFALDAGREASSVVTDGEDTDSSVIVLKEEACTVKKCKNNPWCLNHLGATQWTSEETRQEYIDDKLGPEVVVRDGPAGLKNYGATCYANAFLQVWFHNVAFRNGVYAAVGNAQAPNGSLKVNGASTNGAPRSTSPSSSTSSATIAGSDAGSRSPPTARLSPLHHLANIFAMMHFSNKAVVDPGALIEALRLNKGDQQDAAEFSKLFMSLLTDEFKRHGALKSFVSDHFQGVYEYQTRCQRCGYTSRNESAFLELEISLKDKSSLQERLAHLLQPELMSGSNQYRCPSCASLQDATRSTILKKLPPVLHFSLLRFVYDPNSGTRKKSKAQISYPRELKFGDDYYDLRGVVVHQGGSAFHGHFTCEVYDEDLKEWYFTSDEQVDKLSDRQAAKKRPRLDPDVVEEQISKDAYMLVYKRRELHPTPQDKPPASLLEAINADNTAMQAEIEERDPKRFAIADEFDRLRATKLSVLAQLRGDDKVVPKDSLQGWIKSRGLASSWEYTAVTCEHGNIDPKEAGNLRLISQAAFDKLMEFNADLAEDRTLRDIDICTECVADKFIEEVEDAEHNERIRNFDSLNEMAEDGEGRYAVPLDFVKDWRKQELSTPPPLPSDVEYSLFCEHNRPWGKKKVMWVSGAALMFLRSIFGEFAAYSEATEACNDCGAQTQAAANANKAWKLQVKEEALLLNQKNVTQILNMANYMLPKKFAEDWKKYLSQSGRKPTLEHELCRHNLLDFDPQVEARDYLTEEGWAKLCQLYEHDPQDAITAVFTGSPPEGKTRCIDKVSVATCEECRKARLSDFEVMELTIVVGMDTAPTPTSTWLSTRSSTRRTMKNKQVQLDVTKKMNVKDIKVELYSKLSIGPLFQQLYYKGRELASDETVESIGLLQGDHLNVVEIVEVDDFEEAANEGFGGTALVGRVSCPACTYSNEPGAEKCSVCETAFLS